MAWNPFGVLLEISATAGTVTRTSATQFTVKITASWETYYSGAQTNYGMTASSGGSSVTLNPFGTKSSGKSATFTGTYSISGNAAAAKTVAVTFRNFNNDNGDSATKAINLSVNVPAWTSYTVKYNANGGSGAPSTQYKTHGTALTLSTTKPTKSSTSAGNYTVTLNANGGTCSSASLTAKRTTSYTFSTWNTNSSGTGTSYASGASYTTNAALSLYAIYSSSTSTASVTLPTPTRDGYDFMGWATSSTASSGTTGSYKPTGNVTLYAIWGAKGLVYIGNEAYQIYIGNGSSWDLYAPYVGNGSGWDLCS
jgi:uncharacterized repeat protein (TIGR02543 family)